MIPSIYLAILVVMLSLSIISFAYGILDDNIHFKGISLLLLLFSIFPFAMCLVQTVNTEYIPVTYETEITRQGIFVYTSTHEIFQSKLKKDYDDYTMKKPGYIKIDTSTFNCTLNRTFTTEKE